MWVAPTSGSFPDISSITRQEIWGREQLPRAVSKRLHDINQTILTLDHKISLDVLNSTAILITPALSVGARSVVGIHNNPRMARRLMQLVRRSLASFGNYMMWNAVDPGKWWYGVRGCFVLGMKMLSISTNERHFGPAWGTVRPIVTDVGFIRYRQFTWTPGCGRTVGRARVDRSE